MGFYRKWAYILATFKKMDEIRSDFKEMRANQMQIMGYQNIQLTFKDKIVFQIYQQ